MFDNAYFLTACFSLCRPTCCIYGCTYISFRAPLPYPELMRYPRLGIFLTLQLENHEDLIPLAVFLPPSTPPINYKRTLYIYISPQGRYILIRWCGGMPVLYDSAKPSSTQLENISIFHLSRLLLPHLEIQLCIRYPRLTDVVYPLC